MLYGLRSSWNPIRLRVLRAGPNLHRIRGRGNIHDTKKGYPNEPSFDRDCSLLRPPYSVTRDPSRHRQRSLDSSRSGRLGSKLPLAYLTPFLHRMSLRFLDHLRPMRYPLFFGSHWVYLVHGSTPWQSKKRRSCAILR
ncbi:hypothetical protein RND71_015774 [Anisodus tanguticus]|uniref:Uncharacterized protein n=1 Tax=Anisodus tanguticus TaxID=243964 RepID=A0AAE1S8K8_9SOLA|nr:hypothetical protein RND71_015774 [Anisodus tanguticus]